MYVPDSIFDRYVNTRAVPILVLSKSSGHSFPKKTFGEDNHVSISWSVPKISSAKE